MGKRRGRGPRDPVGDLLRALRRMSGDGPNPGTNSNRAAPGTQAADDALAAADAKRARRRQRNLEQRR